MSERGEKRQVDDANNDEENSEDDWVGPLPSEAAAVPQAKKRKILEHEAIYRENLPLCETYEVSFMHRDIITHVVATSTDFVITASCDGHVKFWKKLEEGIEFVKHFKAHLESIQDMSANCNGFLLCTASVDKSVKIFDIINFDMMNMFKLSYTPNRVEWVHSAREAIASLAITDADSNKIYIYDGRGSGDAVKVLSLHAGPVTVVRYNVALDFVVSGDRKGIIEYWGTAAQDYETPKIVKFPSKLDTDLFTFAKSKTFPLDIAFSPDGQKFSTMSADRHVRLFRTLTGKLILVLDETLARITELQQKKQMVPHMEFGRRMAGERDIDRTEAISRANAVFDSSGHFLLYPTMLGVKVVNLETHRVVGLLGRTENLRPLKLALFQGVTRKNKASVTLELEAADNPLLDSARPDPTLFCTAVKKNRFYLFSKRPATDTEGERDVFNEKPSKEDIVAATDASGAARLADGAVLFTEMGDIHVTLYPRDAPKAVENFCSHARNGYFNGHIFHRVIKGFMIQTGDPTGTGSGGESIWGGEFEDEFSPNLKHDKAFTLSMANAGPNTNGSQFFITVAPTPWLDNKHTVFGRVHKGMEVVLSISNAKVNAKTSKPYDDIRILSVGLK